MSLKRHLMETRRIAVLRLLLEVTNRTLPNSVIHRALADLGHEVERDVVNADLSFLESVDLVAVEILDRDKDVRSVRLTPNGARAGRGEIRVTGVALPYQD